ncbi:hypothetical protein NC653_030916 [Populus alba x Populus x berolinensis]|uniref:Uncharacterized protein n=1 Tax=Populus alba x Populus x berolinensis TaxID=444605 RepID=A0AAD6LX40_9ROSI|nr:hypothetical protein NC653_030916 [Populus alba x Populus x berolinensis]
MDSCQANLFWFSRLIGFREPGRMLLNLCTVSSGSYPTVPIDKFSFRFHVLPNKRQLIFLTWNSLQIQFIPKGFYMHLDLDPHLSNLCWTEIIKVDVYDPARNNW